MKKTYLFGQKEEDDQENINSKIQFFKHMVTLKRLIQQSLSNTENSIMTESSMAFDDENKSCDECFKSE